MAMTVKITVCWHLTPCGMEGITDISEERGASISEVDESVEIY
jgi:hypothetical protein